MNPEVLTVSGDMTLPELSEFLLAKEISGAPVVDEAGRPVGVVSLTDVAAAATGNAAITSEQRRPNFYLRDLQETYNEEDLHKLHIEGGGDLQVADVMTRAVFSVEEEANVAEVASMMLKAHLHRVLVTRGEEIVGIISTSDLLGLLVDEV